MTDKFIDMSTPGGTRVSENPPVVFSTAAEARILEASPIILPTSAHSGADQGISEDSCHSLYDKFGNLSWQNRESGGEAMPSTLNLESHRQVAVLTTASDGMSRKTEKVERAPKEAVSEGPLTKSQVKRRRRKAATARRNETPREVEGVSEESRTPLVATVKRNRSAEVTPTETAQSLGTNAASSSSASHKRKKLNTPHPSADGSPRAQVPHETGAATVKGRSSSGRKLDDAGRSINRRIITPNGGSSCAQNPSDTSASTSKGCSSGGRKLSDAGKPVKTKNTARKEREVRPYKRAAISALALRIGKAGNDDSMTVVECKHCEDQLWELAKAGNACIQVEGCALENGTFRVKCSTQQTFEWLSSSVPKIPPLGTTIFEVFRPPKLTRAFCFIPGQLRKTADVLARLHIQNPGLDTKKWKIYSHRESKNRENKDGSTLTVGLDKASVETIRSRYDCRPYLHLGRIYFQIISKQCE